MDGEPQQYFQEVILKKSLVLLFFKFTIAEVFLAGCYLAVVVAIEFVNFHFGIDLGIHPLTLTKSLLFTLLEILVTAYFFLQWNYNYYILRTKEVIYMTGIIVKQKRSYALDNVQSVSSRQGIFGVLFNFGTITIFSPALKSELQLTEIPNPNAVTMKIKQMNMDQDNKMGYILKH